MRKGLVVLAIAAAVLAPAGLTKGQTPQTPAGAGGERPAAAPDRVLGEVTALDPANQKISVKAETGQTVTVSVNDKTHYRRIPPGETSAERAAVITFAEVAVGDRVLARGKLDAGVIQTRLLLVMSRTDLARSEEQSRAEWQRRGISGTIVGLDPATKELAVRVRTAAGPVPIRVTASGGGVRFKRYAPDSTRYRDAVPSSFEQLKVGDQINALGDRSEDGATFKPEEIVSGSFRMAGGIITAVNRETGEVTIKDIRTQQPLTVVVGKQAQLRRLPAELLARMEESMQAGPPQTTQVAGGGTVQEVRVMTPTGPGVRYIRRPPPGQQPGQTGQPGQPTAANSGAGAPGAQGSRPPPPQGDNIRTVLLPAGAAPTLTQDLPGANVDYQQEIERLAPITIADLKPGDGIIVSSASGGDPSRVTAITLAAGVEDFLKRQEEARKARPGFDLDLELPGLGAQQ
ncbi:MAG TPA: hypothetical protein VN282_17805 [Pyrinomonadaceae bacterium]|nr:hypothetical protein [Pyrinomonadaceae bacterium]